jgi:hypothetical protein
VARSDDYRRGSFLYLGSAVFVCLENGCELIADSPLSRIGFTDHIHRNSSGSNLVANTKELVTTVEF